MWESTSKETLGLRPGENILRVGSTPDYLWCLTNSQVLKVDHLSGFVITPYDVLPEEDLTWGSTNVIGSVITQALLNDFTATQGWVNDLGYLRGPNFQDVPISTVYVDRFGDVWVGTWGGPVFYGDIQMRHLDPLPYGLAQTNAEIVIPAKNGIWIGGTSNSNDLSGLTFFDNHRGFWDLYRVGYEISFGESQIYCGVAVGEEWWFGTPNGIQIYTPQKDSWFLLGETKGLPDIRVTRIVYDGDYVYAGTPLGLVRISPDSRTRAPWRLSRRLKNLTIRDLYWDGDNLWVSSDFGLWKWHSDTERIERFSTLDMDKINTDPKSVGLLSPVTAVVSSDSIVYFGDEFGILSYRKGIGEWQRYSGESQLVGFQILSLSLSENDTIMWIGTTQGAIVVNMSSGYIRQFKEMDGLPTNIVRSVVVDDDIVWLGTPEGLVRFQWEKHLQ